MGVKIKVIKMFSFFPLMNNKMCMNVILLYIFLAFVLLYMINTPSMNIEYNPEIYHPAFFPIKK
jgi:hypothetical protein